MPEGKGYGDSMHRGETPAKKPLGHHSPPGGGGGTNRSNVKSTTTPPFKNVGDSRQKSHSY